MASGSFERAFVSSRTPAECWTVLTDVDQLAGWVDIVRDVTTHAPLSSYGATLEDRIGPFSLRADLDVSVMEAEEPHRVMFEASGQDRQVGSRLHIRAGMELDRSNETGTHVRFSGTYAVEGRVATLGAPMIHRKAAAILDKFTARAEQELR
jgi:carbon monoxide dehydrogenase subunit G